MAQLTWREMQAPDLSTSLRGYQQFTSLLDSALGRAQGTVDRIDGAMNERANTGALKIAAAIQDPEQAKAILTDPRLMNDRVNAQTVGALAARPGQLINQAAAETNLADMKRTQSQSIAQDALAGDIARGYELRAAEGAGTLGADGRAELRDINARISAAAGQVGSKNTLTNLGALSGAEDQALGRASTRLGMDRTRQDMSQSATRFNWDVTDRADQQAGMAAFMAMQNQSYDRESALASFTSGEFSKLSPGAKMYALQQLNSSWGNIYQPEDLASMSGFSGSGGGGAGTGMNVMNYQARGAGFGAVPANIQTMGDASAYADKINAAGVPSSAMGPYQIVGNTRDGYAKKLFGANWKSQPYSVENETRIATAIFNDNKGSAQALRNQWVSLSPAEAERVRKMPAQQALAYIANKESGASAASLFGTQAGAALRIGQDRVGKSSAGALIQAAANGPTNPLDVVDQLKGNARFAGTSREFLTTEINDIVRRSNGNITPAQAGVILQDAARENNDSWGWVNRLSGNSVRINKAGDRLNRTYIDNEIKRAAGGGLVQDAVREADVQTSVQGMAVAQANLSRAQSAYQNAIRRQAVQPGVAAQIPRLKAQLDAAQAAVINAQGGVERVAAPRSAQTQPAGQQSKGGSLWDELTGLFTVHHGNQ